MEKNRSSLDKKINNIIKELNAEIIQNSKNNEKINAIINSLRSYKSWHVIEPLKSVLENPRCPLHIQQKILELFGNIQDPRVISVLASYLDDTNEKLKNTAIKSLSFISSPKVTPYLIAATKEQDKWIKIFAIHGLVKNASPKVTQPLIHLLGDSEEEVRKEAINALSRLRIENIDDLLIKALNSEDRYIKLGVVSLLGTRNVVKSTSSLLPLIGSEDRRLNLIVCNTLSILSNEKSLRPLLEMSVQIGDINNQYMLCMQKMDKKIIPTLIKIYLEDHSGTYSEHIEELLTKFSLITHDFIVNLKTTEENPEMITKLDHLEKQI